MDQSSLTKVVHPHCHVSHTFNQELGGLFLSLTNHSFRFSFSVVNNIVILTVRNVFKSPCGRNSITRAGELGPATIHRIIEPESAFCCNTFSEYSMDPHNVVVVNLAHDAHFILKLVHHLL